MFVTDPSRSGQPLSCHEHECADPPNCGTRRQLLGAHTLPDKLRPKMSAFMHSASMVVGAFRSPPPPWLQAHNCTVARRNGMAHDRTVFGAFDLVLPMMSDASLSDPWADAHLGQPRAIANLHRGIALRSRGHILVGAPELLGAGVRYLVESLTLPRGTSGRSQTR